MPWTTILREQFLDARLSALFSGDLEKAAKAKYLWGELLALNEYIQCAHRERRVRYERGVSVENKYLDPDGGTTYIQHLLRTAELRLEKMRHDMRSKHCHLKPTGHADTLLGKFEHRYLSDGKDGFALRQSYGKIWQAGEGNV